VRFSVRFKHQCAYRTAVFALSALEQLGGHDAVQYTNWSILRKQRGRTELCVDGEVKNAKADL
jgi:hypothetical protein